MNRIILIFVVIATISLTACSNAATPENAIAVAAEVTQTATLSPTVSIPTATPTEVLPTATVTRPPTSPPATPTPIPSPTPTPHIYIVQQFDTLFGLAIEFDTTIDALVAANGIEDKNFLLIGQELIIPPSTEVQTAAPVAQTTSDTEQISSSVAESTPITTTTITTSTNPPQVNEAEVITADQSQTNAAEVAAATGPTTTDPAPPAATPSPVPVSGPPPPAITHPAHINPLTGLPVDDPAKLQRRPLMVRIGNDVGARVSQVGLNSTDMVYEEITEWWVTRFTAIFLAETPDTVGPVRSARLINVQLVPQYQGALAHSGGSDPVRWEISQAPLANLDEYYNPSPYFYRPNEGWQTRLAIDAQAARDYMAAKGLDAPVALHGFPFSDTIEGGEPGEHIYIPYPQATSFTEWHYDAASGKYLRWINGSPLYDVSSGQVAATNVIVYFAEHQATDIVEDSNGATSIRPIINGQGPAWFFRDGKLNKGFWQTDGTRTPYFAYEDGRPYSLKPGNTWVEVVPTYFTIGLNSADEASSRP